MSCSAQKSAKMDLLATEEIKSLRENVANGTYPDITSALVSLNGDIVLEDYYNGASDTTRHDTRSVGKSLVSTLMGLAIQDGYIHNEMQTIDAYYDLDNYENPTERKAQITIRDLLMMHSAFDGSDIDPISPGHEERMYVSEDWVKFVLDLDTRPETRWDYFTGGPVLLGDLLDNATPDGLEAYADQRLFEPLGITSHRWQYTPQGVPNTAGGIRMTSRDLLKYGESYKSNDLQSQEWIDKTFTHYHDLPIGGYGYGYLFWKTEVEIDGQKEEVYFASGNGGNRVCIFKNLPIVAVITATRYNTMEADVNTQKILVDHIVPALDGMMEGR